MRWALIPHTDLIIGLGSIDQLDNILLGHAAKPVGVGSL